MNPRQLVYLLGVASFLEPVASNRVLRGLPALRNDTPTLPEFDFSDSETASLHDGARAQQLSTSMSSNSSKSSEELRQDAEESEKLAGMLAFFKDQMTLEEKMTGESNMTSGEACEWSEKTPAYASWPDPITGKFDSMISTFNQVNVKVELYSSTLLGAVRHQGTIPYDMDMDVIFDACSNLDLLQSIPKYSKFGCDDWVRINGNMGGYGFSEAMWHQVLKPKLAGRLHYVKTTSYGIRMSNGAPQWDGGLPNRIGVGIDVVVTAGTHSLKFTREGVPSNAVCCCNYGSTNAYCSRHAKQLLTTMYGANYMTPKSQCRYYAEKAVRDHHDNWNWRSQAECTWPSRYHQQSTRSDPGRTGQCIK